MSHMPLTQIYGKGKGERTYEDVEVVVERHVEVMGERVERARPPERDGAGEHGPQCEEQNGR